MWTRKGVKSRVSRAVAWLDENYPGWARKVPITRFRIDRTQYYDVDGKKCGCVTVHTGIDPHTMPAHVQDATLWGNIYGYEIANREQLQEEWEAAIRERKGQKVKA